MKKQRLSLLLFLIACGTVAGYAFAGQPGETGVNFLRIPIGARAAGMGGAFVAVSDDSSGFYYNPAGLSRLQCGELSCMGVRWPGDMDFGYVCAASRFKNSGFGISYVALSKNDIPGYDATGVETGNTGFSDTMIALTYSFMRTVDRQKEKYLHAGANVKIVRENLDTESAIAVAFDAGLIYAIKKDIFNIGLCVQNIGTGIKFYSAACPMPVNYKIGTSFKPFGSGFLVAVDFDIPVDNYASLNAGCEYRINQFFTLRAGYREKPAEKDLDEGVRCGIGFESDRVNVDYAYAPYGFIGEAHRFGLSYRFAGLSGKDRISGIIERHFKKAVRLYGLKDYVRANGLFKGILSLNPGHEASAEYVKKIAEEIKDLRVNGYIEAGKKEFENNNLLEAKEAFENVIMLLPDDTQAREWILRLDEKLNKEKKKTADILFSDGFDYFKKGQYEEAVQCWKKALTIMPEHAESRKYVELAGEKLRQQEKEKELETLSKNLREADLLYEKAVKLAENKKYDKAAETAQEALKLNPGHQNAKELLNTAKKQLSLRFYEEAKKAFYAGRITEAAKAAKAAAELDSDLTAAKALLREIENKLNGINKNKADQLNKKALEKYSEGKIDEAIKLWEEALAACPQHENSRNNLNRAREEIKGK